MEIITICEKTKKKIRRKIKIILINIWFKYFFDLCFHLKMLSWSSNFFSLNLVSNFWKTNAIWSFT